MSGTRTMKYFVVDAFTSRPFGGNPAAVMPLEAWLDDATLQTIAAEMALSETAFFVPETVDGVAGFRLRWMTPACEVDLCGHATLATAAVLMTQLEPARTSVRFHSKSGPLDVTRTTVADGQIFTLDFPARVPERVDDAALVAAAGRAVGATPRELWRSRNLMVVVDDAATVRALAPDFRAVNALPTEGVIVTAPADPAVDGPSVDFVSRYFTPQHGIDEDPVTGSAHCTLTPYWATRLGKTTMSARQVSKRGGELAVEMAGDRVKLGGRAVLVARGDLLLP
ncbi:MAG TPA: PhzF family phenazine biosynthesis protein [Kofleriaceae bacterium]|nr:PhzF family phenazine biosynthesis protein [Kofleriaceae bacterium]